MACVSRRRGKWVLDYRDQHGKRRWETFDTREEADDALATRLKQLRAGSYVAPRDVPTFKEVAKDWLATKSDRRVSTISQWEVHLDLHLVPAIGALRLDKIRVADFDRFKADRLATGLKPQTVNKLLTTAAAIFKYANRCELIEKNPAAVVERCRTNAGELTNLDDDSEHRASKAVDPDDVLSPEEVGRLIDKVTPGLLRTYLMVAVLTGARSGEVSALRWSDIDLDAGTARIRRSVTWARRRGGKGRAEPRFYQPKTKSSRRTVELAPALVAQIRRWKLACPPSPDGLVFPNANETPMHRTSIAKNGLDPALAEAKLRKVSLHSLRHTFASGLIVQGRPATEVAARLGHSSASVTMQYYAHWFTTAKSDAVRTFSEAVLGSQD